MRKLLSSVAFLLAFAVLPAAFADEQGCSTDLVSGLSAGSDWRGEYMIRAEDSSKWQRAIISSPTGILQLSEDERVVVKGTADPYSEVQIYLFAPEEDAFGKLLPPSSGTCLWTVTADSSGFFRAEIHPNILWDMAGEEVIVDAFFHMQKNWAQQNAEETNQNFFIGTNIQPLAVDIGYDVSDDDCEILCEENSLLPLKKAHIIRPSAFPTVSGSNFDFAGNEDIAVSKLQHTLYAGSKDSGVDASELAQIPLKSLVIETLKQYLLGTYGDAETPMDEITTASIQAAISGEAYSGDIQEILSAIGDVMENQSGSAERESAIDTILSLILKTISCNEPECVLPTKDILDEILPYTSGAVAPNSNGDMQTNAGGGYWDLDEGICTGDYNYDVDMGVDWSHIEHTINIYVPEGGEYDTIIQPHRGLSWGTHEDCSFRVGTQTGVASYDDIIPSWYTGPPEQFLSRRQDHIGTFSYAAGNNHVTLVALDTESVHVKRICLKKATTASPPTCTLTANPSQIVDGDTVDLSWTTTDATSASLDNGIGSVTLPSGSESVTPSGTTTYVLSVSGSGGNSSCEATITVDPALSDFSVTKEVSLDGVTYSHSVEAEDGTDVYYHIVVTNDGNTTGDVTVLDTVSPPSDGGSLSAPREYATDCPGGATCNGFLWGEGVSLNALSPGDSVTISYVQTSNADTVPLHVVSEINNIALLSTGVSSDAQVLIPSSQSETYWSSDFLKVLQLWTGDTVANECLIAQEDELEMRKNFYDNGDGTHSPRDICQWNTVYANGYSTPAIILDMEKEVFLQPEFSDIRITRVSERFSDGEEGWRLPVGEKSPIYYRYESLDSIGGNRMARSCIKSTDISQYSVFLAQQLGLTSKESALVDSELSSQLIDEQKFYQLEIVDPQVIMSRFQWKGDGERLKISPLFFDITEGACQEETFGTPDTLLHGYFPDNRDGFEVGIVGERR